MLDRAMTEMIFKSLSVNEQINSNLYNLSAPIGYQLCAAVFPWLSYTAVTAPGNIRTRSAEQMIRQYAPYLFKMIDEKADLWLPLNRYYKPLCIYTDESIDYDKYKSLVIPGKYLNIAATKNGYLYDDRTFPKTLKLARRYTQILLHALNAVDSIQDHY